MINAENPLLNGADLLFVFNVISAHQKRSFYQIHLYSKIINFFCSLIILNYPIKIKIKTSSSSSSLDLLWWIQFGVHVGFLLTLTGRSLLGLLHRYQLHFHLYLPLKQTNILLGAETIVKSQQTVR